MPTYARLPVRFVRGEAAWLWDDRGRRYLDALSGIGVCNLGHAHPRLVEALRDQAGRLWHTSNLYEIPLQERLAERICALSGMERAFFCNSGAEANEAAIKIARAYGQRNGIAFPKIVVMEGGFHGRTLGALSATGNAKARRGFGPLLQGFVQVPFGDLDAVRALSRLEGVVAVLVEPIQGEGGVRVPPEGYLRGLREICDRNGWLLMLDEVQTGIGRTGKWFAFQHEGIVPDVVALAKALGNGFPIGACLARGEAAEILGLGMHGSTFGGNPLACRVALEVLEVIASQRLLERAATLGENLLKRLQEAIPFPVRGKGLMIGVDLGRPCGHLVERALERGILINVTASTVVRLLPPLILADGEAERMAETVIDLVRNPV